VKISYTKAGERQQRETDEADAGTEPITNWWKMRKARKK
jgi:hypothetical protein